MFEYILKNSLLINDPIYQQTMLIVLSAIFLGGLFTYLFRKKNFYFVSSWASIKSWLIVAPILFFTFGFPQPIPLIVLTIFSIFGAKAFFQIIGMFHKSWFVLITYLGIYLLTLTIYFNKPDFYNILPVIVLALSCFVPIFKNSYDKMIQYISLTLLGFIFLGWSFLHLGLIFQLPSGVYQVMYLIILTEFCDNTNIALSRSISGNKFLSRINNKRSWGSTIIAIIITLFVAGAMRQLLPDRSEKYWLAAGLISAFGGVFGDLVMTVIRRDAGVKVVGPFILGRGDFLHRMDRLVFVAPIYYYIMKFLG